jgi:ubiquinone/menaquinone biosynthesis C-methylase UbiE
MSDLATWPLGFRVNFLRDLWRRLGAQAGGRPIALYGAGQHTRFLLETVLGIDDGPTVAVILDDEPGTRKEIFGVPVRRPRDAAPESVSLVLVSSDSLEPVLTERASQWAALAERNGDKAPAPTVVRIYGEENAGARRRNQGRYRGVWGSTTDERRGHLPMDSDALILRLPPAAERTPRTPLPLPPPELRAGYQPNNDEAYLASGRNDVAAIRAMIQRHAPAALPLRRVLDWGCSSGRMLRHWIDVTESGGEAWGCDICATAVNWASENLSPPLRFFTSTTRPALPLPDASMDLVYGNSVFTHIRELVDAWLMELRRIVRPGGLVFATILDETSWERCRTEPTNPIRRRCAEIDFSSPLADDFVCYGGAFDPLTFWHSRGIRRRWSFAFDVLAIERGVVPYQTGVLLRRP